MNATCDGVVCGNRVGVGARAVGYRERVWMGRSHSEVDIGEASVDWG